MKRGTPEGRRLFAGCVGVGVVVGIIAGGMAASVFHSHAQLDPCKPDDPTNVDLCKHLDVGGFELHSTWNAGLTIGTVVAVVAWVIAVVAVLYSTGQQHHHHDR